MFAQDVADVEIVLSFRWTGAAVACAMMGFPLIVSAMHLLLSRSTGASNYSGDPGSEPHLDIFYR